MASTRNCSIEGCGRKHHAKGFCGMHMQRMNRRGVPDADRVRLFSPEERFEAYSALDSETGCLAWTGAKQPNGYGVMTRPGGGMIRAHRFAWERANGDIPEGAWIDHVCHRRDCVEVSHLRLADASKNGGNRAGANSTSGTGVRNVHMQGGMHRVRVMKDRKSYCGGMHVSLEDAARAAKGLRAELFGEFAGKGGAL